MKEKRKRIPAIPLGIIIIDDPLSESYTPEIKNKFDSWITKRIESIHPDIPKIILHSRVYERDIYSPKINENMRTSPPKKTSVRLELEAYVYAWNTSLKDTVKTMDTVLLLRNANPAHRSSFASQLFDLGLLSNQQRSEFVIGPPQRQHSRTNWRF